LKYFWVLFLTVLFIFSGCSPTHKPKKTITMTTMKVGMIDQNTLFDHKVIASKLLGFNVQRLVNTRQESVLYVSLNKKEVMVIYPDKTGQQIGSVVVLSPLVENRDGLNVGDKVISTPKITEHIEYTVVDGMVSEIIWKP
jgi:hypothetical protein